MAHRTSMYGIQYCGPLPTVTGGEASSAPGQGSCGQGQEEGGVTAPPVDAAEAGPATEEGEGTVDDETSQRKAG